MQRTLLFVLAIIALAARAQTLQTKTYSTTGHPTEAFVTPDGAFVLVTVEHGNRSSGIDIFHNTGTKLERIASQELGSDNAQGIVLIPHTRTLAVGMSNAGVAFLSLDDALKGKAQVHVLEQGPGSGSGYLAATPDGQTLFVANEYGQGGNVGVILLHADAKGELHPETVAHIPTGRATPGVTLSPDGSRMYAVGEVLPPEAADKLPGHDNKDLRRSTCTQSKDRPMPNGALYIMDTAKLAALPTNPQMSDIRAARAGWSNAGCSPVREAVSADGKLVYITARGDNKVLIFDAAKLSNTGSDALIAAIPTGGEAPVGLKLFNSDKSLLVANSNRFAGGNGSATVIDITNPRKPIIQQTIKTGQFPRNITSSLDGKTLYLTIFLGDELMVLQ